MAGDPATGPVRAGDFRQTRRTIFPADCDYVGHSAGNEVECSLKSLFLRRTCRILCIFFVQKKKIDILEYIHAQGYAHADIKAGNLMTGLAKSESNQVYLIDFGLVKKFMNDGKHIEAREEPKAAHDGTLEFTSVDAHKGIGVFRCSFSPSLLLPKAFSPIPSSFFLS